MNDSLDSSIDAIAEILFLSKILEELYLVLREIGNDPTPTQKKVAEDLIRIARLITERIGEKII